MRDILTVFFGLVLAMGLVGCDSGGNESGPTAQVRFMHASPGAGSVNVVADGDQVLSDVSFSSELTSPTVSEYKEVPVSADAKIAVQSAASGNEVLSTTAGEANLEEGKQYTIIVAGTPSAENAPQPIVLRDRFQDLGDSDIGIRLVHGSALAQAQFPNGVDVYLTSPGADLSQEDPKVSNFTFTDDFPGTFAGAFAPQPITADGSEVSVTPPGGTDNLLPQNLLVGGQGLSVSSGQYITGIAIDVPSQQGVGALIHIDDPDS